MTTYAIVDAKPDKDIGFYVYALLDSGIVSEEFAFEPFYIGKGKLGRAWSHVKGHKSASGNPIKDSRIGRILASGSDIKVGIFQSFKTEAEALQFEAALIRRLGRIHNHTGILINLTDGGDGGTSGIPCSDEKKAAISRANKGKIRTPEHRENMSRAFKGRESPNKGKKFSEEYRQKLSDAHKGKKQSAESNIKRSQTLRGQVRPPEVIQKIQDTRRKNRLLADPLILREKDSLAAKKAWETRRKNK